MKRALLNGQDANGQTIHILIHDNNIEKVCYEEEDMHNYLSPEVEKIDLLGKLVSPGFVDLHVHLRQPGGEHKETIETGSRAAARGGFTTICSMPNTQPVPDNVQVLNMIQNIIDEEAHTRVKPYAAITQGLQGQVLCKDFQTLKDAGAVAFTDDGVGIQSAGIMEAAMQEIARIGGIIVAHTEDNSLLHGGVVHLGEVSKRLNLPGISSQTEAVQIARDVLLSQSTGCPYHVCHVSTKESVQVIRWAKSLGIPVTAEVSPHHLILSENDIKSDDAQFKMNPPLRSEADRQALIQGLLDGTLDCIATDHAPHSPEEKNQSMRTAPFGIIGSEIAFQLIYSHFVKSGIFSLKQVIDWLTIHPSKIFKLSSGVLADGQAADITIIDLDKEWQYQVKDSYSKSQNTPFDGHKLTSDIYMTIVGGKTIYQSLVK